ncbi:alpha-2,8-polysialyltransferase family protein [Porticoccaceae bacterium]|nr:alpha-2,8-polysialyltransferase family protein [Porticoccaceae bacterium]
MNILAIEFFTRNQLIFGIAAYRTLYPNIKFQNLFLITEKSLNKSYIFDDLIENSLRKEFLNIHIVDRKSIRSINGREMESVKILSPSLFPYKIFFKLFSFKKTKVTRYEEGIGFYQSFYNYFTNLLSHRFFYLSLRCIFGFGLQRIAKLLGYCDSISLFNRDLSINLPYRKNLELTLRSIKKPLVKSRYDVLLLANNLVQAKQLIASYSSLNFLVKKHPRFYSDDEKFFQTDEVEFILSNYTAEECIIFFDIPKVCGFESSTLLYAPAILNTESVNIKFELTVEPVLLQLFQRYTTQHK